MKTIFILMVFGLFTFPCFGQWVELDLGMEVDHLSDIYCITPEIVIAVGGNGTILKTIDGGETWSKKTSGTTLDLHKVQFTTPNIGYIISKNSGNILLKTVDGGETWTQIDLVELDFTIDLSCLNENVIFISGWRDRIIKSTDGGQNWETILNVNDVHDIQFLSESVGYSGRYYRKITKTINGGQSWQQIMYGYSPFYFLNENIGFYYNHGIYKTIDGSNSFTKVTDGEEWLLKNILAVNENLLWGIHDSGQGIVKITSSDSEIYSENNFYHSDPDIYLSAIKFANESVGFMVGSRNYGDSGIIWKNDSGINTMDSRDEQLPLFQIYPNPASDELNIVFDNPENVKVTMTDMSGKQIYSKSFNEKKIRINTAQIPKGTYILSVETNLKKHTQKIIIY